MGHCKIHAGLALIWLCVTRSSGAQNTTGNAKAIIIDTDIYSDVDDVGALAVANVLHNCGLADLKGIAINTHSEYGALAANAINTYFDNGEVPVAAIRPLNNETFLDTYTSGEYASKVAYNWPRTLNNTEQTVTPLELYTDVLSTAKDNSITLISIGFLTNIATLLKSPASNASNLNGTQLASAKVKELVIMGGYYPSGWEFNFGGSDPESTTYVLQHWPRSIPITFSGGELGGDIYSGQRLAQHSPPDSPIMAAYEWYVGRCSTIRESWDPITTLYGILGLDGFEQLGLSPPFTYANQYGYNSITASNASNAWVNDTSVTNQHWLQLAGGVTNSSVAWMLDQFFTHDPLDRTCF